MVVQLQQPCRGPLPAPAPDGRGRAMRIVVDRDLCQGHGVCESRGAGGVLGVEEGRAHHPRAEPPEELRAAVELAVKFCPTHALSIEED